MPGFAGERPAWASRILHLTDSMHREVRTWRLFGLTWAASGFLLDLTLSRRLIEHEKTVARFALHLDKKFPGAVTDEIGYVSEESMLGEWQEIRNSHGNLSVAFFTEADRFSTEMGEKAGNWGTFTADMR